MDIRVIELTNDYVTYIIESSTGVKTVPFVVQNKAFKALLAESGQHRLFVDESVNLDDLYQRTGVKFRD